MSVYSVELGQLAWGEGGWGLGVYLAGVSLACEYSRLLSLPAPMGVSVLWIRLLTDCGVGEGD